MAKVMLFENVGLKSRIAIDAEGNLAKNYVDLVLLAIDTPPAGGFTPSANIAATELYKKVNDVKEDSIIEFTVTDFTKVKGHIENLRFPARSTELAEFTEYVNSITATEKAEKTKKAEK